MSYVGIYIFVILFVLVFILLFLRKQRGMSQRFKGNKQETISKGDKQETISTENSKFTEKDRLGTHDIIYSTSFVLAYPTCKKSEKTQTSQLRGKI